MKIIVSFIFLVSIFFGANLNLEDLQKYQQYKQLVKNSDTLITRKISQNSKIKNIENNIDLNITKEDEDINVVKNIFQYNADLNVTLKRFGENFFQNKNNLNQAIIPTANSYILNSGDTLLINTYSARESKTYDLKIDNNGKISLPKIGPIKVGSLNLSEAKTVISNIIKKAFPNTKVVVDISGYSSIQVTLTGNVKVPGIYNLSSFSTVKDALLASSGLLDVGSYRDINIIRDGKVVYNFDLYKLLNAQDKKADFILRGGDIVNVKFTQKTISLNGKVKYPAIYELKNRESYKDLMQYSGGFNFDATKNSIKLTRYDENKDLKTYILAKKEFFAMKPKDGDNIYVFNNLYRSKL